MLTLALKLVHVLAGFFFLGGGAMTAYYKLRADTSGDLRVLVWYQREIVRADWFFTVPSGLLAPATGALLVVRYGIAWDTPWIWWGIGGWMFSGILWVPAAFLQYRMRRLAEQSLEAGVPLPPEFQRANRIWMALGVPSFLAAAFTVWVMIAKWAL